MNKEEFTRLANNKHNYRYDYYNVEFVNMITKVSIVCKEHGTFSITPSNHLRGYMCSECGKAERARKILLRNKTGTISQETFIGRCIGKHPDLNYTNTVYCGSNKRITVECTKHGEFTQFVSYFFSKNGGCQQCNQYKIILDRINKSKIKFNNKFTYDDIRDDKHNTIDPIKLTCIEHGLFDTTWMLHFKSKNGNCPICMANLQTKILVDRNSITQEYFLEKCKKIHNDAYDYSKTIFITTKAKINIICKLHGMFTQSAEGHSSGNGCQKCASMDKSKMESDWLDTFNIPNEYRNYRLKINDRIIIVDGYNKSTNTIYEFWGDFWHGNPLKYDKNDTNKRNKKTFGELYELTLNKIKFIKDNGYNLIDVWEYDWCKK